MGERRTSRPFPTPFIGRGTEGADTMQAWERFLTGVPNAGIPARNFVVASWLRSQQLGIDPTGRSAPLVARGDAIQALRRRHADLLSAAATVFAQVADVFSGSRSIMGRTKVSGGACCPGQ